ncbi:RNA polymerase II subunit A C-terminal domain phosphatase-like [Ornithodoros turicata]|uniref:RNA polymerase II subunit A C-terminal domain phosphatase-like n=1 Tax=Ornithodoros turicata TaxID=34597 RepID=UPI00313A4ACF
MCSMAASAGQIVHSGDAAIRILKWRIKSGSRLSHGTGLLLYEPVNSSSSVVSDLPLKLKSCHDGTVEVLVAKEGSVVNPGDVLLQLKQCTHPIVMKDLCAECGADLRGLCSETQDGVAEPASISMIHHVPELRVSHEQAQQLGKADERRLLSYRKLVLLVDLDQTLIHTTSDYVPPNIQDVHHFQLYGPQSPWYHTRIRPGTKHFLEQVSQHYELHICTFGARPYAHTIASLLDPDGKYFSYRILSRDECFNPTSKTGNLKALFPCGDSMVCIIDDREDVWNYALNLVPVKPYVFFKNTGDINAPGGVQIRSENGRWPEAASNAPAIVENGNFTPTGVTDTHEESSDTALNAPDSANGDSSACEKSSTDASPENTGDLMRDEEVCQPKDVAISLEKVEDIRDGTDDATKLHNVEEDHEIAGKTPVEHGNIEGVTSVEVVKAKDIIESTTTDVNAESSVNNSGNTNSGARADEESKESLKQKPESLPGSSDDIEDDDDYLLYLEEILRTIHKAYYDIFDQLQAQHSKGVPDLKNVVPYVRRKCLKGVQVVFSGVIPTNQDPEKSKIYQVARSLGAKVAHDLGPGVTHLVAARPGTAKTNKARRMGGIHLVNPGWLWCCAERWEHVAEQLFPLAKCENMVAPQQCPIPIQELERKVTMVTAEEEEVQQKVPGISVAVEMPVYDPVTGKRIWTVEQRELKERITTPHTASTDSIQQDHLEDTHENDGSLTERTNPHLSMSPDELKAMDREVEDACSEGDDDDDSSNDGDPRPLPPLISEEESSTESLTGGECPKGWRKRNRNCTEKNKKSCVVDDLEGIYEDDQELPVLKFPRCELPEDSDRSVTGDGDSSDNTSVGSADEEMAAAVEREFLGL